MALMLFVGLVPSQVARAESDQYIAWGTTTKPVGKITWQLYVNDKDLSEKSTLAYCFNMNRATPDLEPEHTATTPQSVSTGLAYYTGYYSKVDAEDGTGYSQYAENVNTSNLLKDASGNPDFARTIRNVIYYGYRGTDTSSDSQAQSNVRDLVQAQWDKADSSEKSKYNNSFDQFFYHATQLVVWHFTDSLDYRSSGDVSTVLANAADAIKAAALADTDSTGSSTYKLNLFTGGKSAKTKLRDGWGDWSNGKGYQDLLTVSPVGRSSQESTTGTLTISKTVQDANGNKTTSDSTEFSFVVELGSNYANKSVSYTVDGTSKSADADPNGKVTISGVKGGQTAIISGIPTGTTYKVTENEVDGYTQTESSNTSGSITASGVTASFTNKPAGTEPTDPTEPEEPETIAVDITATKTLKATDGEKLSKGQFEFELYDSKGTKLETTTNAENGYIAFTNVAVPAQEGEYTYTIKEVAKDGYTADSYEQTVTVKVTAAVAGDVKYYQAVTESGASVTFSGSSSQGYKLIKSSGTTTISAADNVRVYSLDPTGYVSTYFSYSDITADPTESQLKSATYRSGEYSPNSDDYKSALTRVLYYITVGGGSSLSDDVRAAMITDYLTGYDKSSSNAVAKSYVETALKTVEDSDVSGYKLVLFQRSSSSSSYAAVVGLFSTQQTTSYNASVSAAAFHNTKNVSGLTIGKTVVDGTNHNAVASDSTSFPITVTLKNASGSNFTGSVTVAYSDGTTESKTVNNGSLTLNLKHGQTATLSGLTGTVNYTVSESDSTMPTGYRFYQIKTVATGDATATADADNRQASGTLSNGESVTASFENEMIGGYGSLSISKALQDTYGKTYSDSTSTFTFGITLTKADGTPYANQTLTVSNPYGTGYTYSTNANGEVQYTRYSTTTGLPLKGAQTAVISNLPSGVTWKVTESNIPSNYKLGGIKIENTQDKATDLSTGSASGKIVADVTSEATFTNTYHPSYGVTFKIKKYWSHDNTKSESPALEANTPDVTLEVYRKASNGTMTLLETTVLKGDGSEEYTVTFERPSDGSEIVFKETYDNYYLWRMRTDVKRISERYDGVHVDINNAEFTTNFSNLTSGGTNYLYYYNATTSFKVSKTVVDESDKTLTTDTTSFPFTATLTHSDYTPYANKSVSITIDGQTTQTTTDENGKVTFYLQQGQTAEIGGLPPTSDYVIEEGSVSGYTQQSATGDFGTTAKGESNTTPEAKFVNQKTTVTPTGLHTNTTTTALLTGAATGALAVFGAKLYLDRRNNRRGSRRA